MADKRTVALSEQEMIALGEEMLVWVKERKDSILHLSEWYTIHKGFTYKQWKTFIQKLEFIPYYEQALKIVGLKYLDKTSNVRDGISQRWQRSYFQDLTEREDQEAKEAIEREKEKSEYEHKLKTESGLTIAPEELEKFDALMQKFSRRQSSSKIEQSNVNAETSS